MQLRKKLCYFMIMILSCCDLLVVLTSHPLTGLAAMLWLTGKINVYPGWLVISLRLSDFFVGSSLLALLVMSVDRYLATHYPLFHRTSVTKGKLLTLFAFLFFIPITLTIMSINNSVIPYQFGLLIFGILVIPLLLFINYKLFTVARKSRRNNGVLRSMKKSFSLKNVSGCLLVVACLIVLYIPVSVHIGQKLSSKETEFILDNAEIAGLWAKTMGSMNSTFNCCIFFWKNRTLGAEGMKVIKSMKVSRKSQSRCVGPEQPANNAT